MAEPITKATKANPLAFLNSVKPEAKRQDGLTLLKIFQKATGKKPVMWGSSIVGFGKFHYKSERSSQEGDWPLAAFSPRKQTLTLYVVTHSTEQKALLKKLGKHSTSVSCLYINKLDDVDLKVLSDVVAKSYRESKKIMRARGFEVWD
jgi:hypothetical protein